ncbi:MAG: PKD domain-containing protein, partial [Chitinophagales bacterium]|nr:PKD domain-containing protein [Chitinophagales bacterium]
MSSVLVNLTLLFVRLIICLNICLYSIITHASHLVGGELYYDNLGGGNYRITLKLYRDCNCTNCAPFGDPEYISIYNAGGDLIRQLALPKPPNIELLSSVINNPCLVATDVCVEHAIYTGVTNLPPIGGGYTLIYQRCCRNNTINNVVQNQGATYVTRIPGSDVVQNSANSSPRFKNFPPIFICNNAPLTFDHSATDPDGNELRYTLVAPFDGATEVCPDPSPASAQQGNCPTVPFPYGPVVYTGIFNEKNPMNDPPNNGVMKIDSLTGILTVTPNRQGQYVVGVRVDEYRNGVLISSVIRDFQFNVVQCNIPIAEIPAISYDPATGIGIYRIECKNNSVNFIPNIYNPPPVNNPVSVFWDFGVPALTDDTSNQPNPTYVYPDTGTYLVTLIVSKVINNQGCYDTAKAFVKIYPVLTPDFVFPGNVRDTCQGVELKLSDASVSTSGKIISWFWNFGDGTTSAQQNPSKNYQNHGSYTITLTVLNEKGCRDAVSKNVNVYPLPVADFSTQAVCINQPTIFTDASTISPPGTITSYSWNFDNVSNSQSRSPVFVFPSAGQKNVSLIVRSDKGCADTIEKTVQVNPLPQISLQPKLLRLCPGKKEQVFASGGVSYIWFPSTYLDNPTSSSPFVSSPDSNITLVVQVTDNNGCSNKDSLRVEVFPRPNVDAGPDTSVCLNPGSFRDSVMLLATGAATYVWTPSEGLNDSTVFNPISRPKRNTTYYVTGTDLNGCSNTDSVRVYFLDPSINLILEDDKPICVGQEGSVTVVDQGASVYLWSPPDYVSNPTIFNPKFYPPVSTQYILNVSNYCYTKNDTVVITVYDIPEVEAGNDTSIYRDLPVKLNGYTNGTDYYWFPGNNVVSPFQLNTLAYPEKSQWYYLYAFNPAGCVAVDSIFVTVIPMTRVLLPTGFSPNGDGINDIFRVTQFLNIKELKWFRVFNRWGEMLFETKNLQEGWDGTFKGSPQPLSNYVWTLRAIT